jgi:16S rRNA (guanine1516-N2)-methyltransferase
LIAEFKILDNKTINLTDAGSEKVKEFARQYDLEIIESISDLSDEQAVFEFKNNKLFLNMFLDGDSSSIHFDLDEGSVSYRAKKVSKSNELIARAIGCKSNYRPRVLDATAGMGRDSFIMAKLGCYILMQERCLPIYLLLKNALNRLIDNQPELKNSLYLQKTNSIESFEKLDSFDVIYLDPMFPSRKKSALVKKEMRLFKKLAGEDQDADSLLSRALDANVKRVVVKRPKGAPELKCLKPSHQISSKNFRFDVYLIKT